jgi:multisubunit Na+/H+ antiporter MnhB subunit
MYTSGPQNEDHVSISGTIPDWTRLDSTKLVVIIVVITLGKISVTFSISIYVKFKS